MFHFKNGFLRTRNQIQMLRYFYLRASFYNHYSSSSSINETLSRGLKDAAARDKALFVGDNHQKIEKA